MLYRPNPNKIDSIFLLYDLMAVDVQNNLLSKIGGSTVGHAKVDDIRYLQIPLPPTLGEQRAIAEALSDADALIESLEQLIAKKRAIKQGAMQELLTGKRRLPGFDGEWETKRLEELAEIDPEQLGSETRPDYQFRYISLEDVDFGFLRSYSQQIFRFAPSRARRKLRYNDVLISTVRPNLKSHLWFKDEASDWVCSTGFAVIRCKETLSYPGYIFAQLFSDLISRQIENLLTGSNYPAINSSDVKQLQIPTTSLKEQAAIANILSDMDTEIAALEAKLSKAQQLKQAMVQELLTGKTRLVELGAPK
jgi:type I restriction enzyme S subunit